MDNVSVSPIFVYVMTTYPTDNVQTTFCIFRIFMLPASIVPSSQYRNGIREQQADRTERWEYSTRARKVPTRIYGVRKHHRVLEPRMTHCSDLTAERKSANTFTPHTTTTENRIRSVTLLSIAEQTVPLLEEI